MRASELRQDLKNLKELIEQEDEKNRGISFTRVLFFGVLSSLFLFIYAAIWFSGTRLPILSLLLNMGTELFGSLIVTMVPFIILSGKIVFKNRLPLTRPTENRLQQTENNYDVDEKPSVNRLRNFVFLLLWALIIGVTMSIGLIAVFSLANNDVNFDLTINLISEFFGALAVYSILNQAIKQLSERNPILEELIRLEGKYPP